MEYLIFSGVTYALYSKQFRKSGAVIKLKSILNDKLKKKFLGNKNLNDILQGKEHVQTNNCMKLLDFEATAQDIDKITSRTDIEIGGNSTVDIGYNLKESCSK